MADNVEIVGIGYCSIDYLCILPHIPMDDKVEIMQSMVQGGGPAATAIVAAARLGAKTAFIGAVGDDERGEGIIDSLATEEINVSGMKVRKVAESPAAFCWIEKSSGKRSIAWTRGGVKPLAAGEFEGSMLKGVKLLHLDGHQTEAAIAAAEFASKNNVTVSIDAGTLVPGIEKLLALSNIIIASEKFALCYTGECDMVNAVKKLFERNCRFSAVTMGSKGSLGFDGKNIIEVPAFKIDVVDTTGAGDVFHGAFAYRYVKGGNWEDCMRFSSAVSALKCMKFGGRTGIPSLEQTEKFLSGKNETHSN